MAVVHPWEQPNPHQGSEGSRPVPRNLGSERRLLWLGENQTVPREPVLHAVEERVPLADALVQHEDTDVPAGTAALLTDDRERVLALGVLVLGGPLQAPVGVHRLQAHGIQLRDRLGIRPVHADVDRTDALDGDEGVGTGEVFVVDLGVDVAVAGELGEEHLDATGDDDFAVQDGPDVAERGHGLGAVVGEEGGETGEEVHLNHREAGEHLMSLPGRQVTRHSSSTICDDRGTSIAKNSRKVNLFG